MRQLDPAVFESVVAMRRDLHRHPELAWEERRTASKVCEYLDGIGVTYRSGVAGTGIVAEIPGGGAATPPVALRADLDALPIREETGLVFSSKVEGIMHACGHDGHTSMLLGAARLLAESSGPLPAPVRLIFQPAEETGLGAKAMIEHGALEGVAMIFGGHLDRHYPLGRIVVTEGAVNASSDRFEIRVGGKGGHAARPHETTDAVVVGALLVTAIQTIVSREVNPAHPSVVTVGVFEAGTAHNVIAGRAHLAGSIRAQDPEVREYLHGSLRRVCEAVGQLHGAEIDFEILEGTPAVINPPAMAALAREAAASVVGSENVGPMEVANMGGEDFSYYLERVPGAYVRFGTVVPGVEPHPAHSSRFDFDEGALAVGALYYEALAREAGRAVAAG
jgi:hippurate hydrolase